MYTFYIYVYIYICMKVFHIFIKKQQLIIVVIIVAGHDSADVVALRGLPLQLVAL